MRDPRISIIDSRLKGTRNIIAVSSGKGGVGKSLVASTLALILSKRSFKVGLLDLDVTSPSTHVILGVKNAFPKEENGVIPLEVHGLKYMSIVCYSGDHALPIRGTDVSNVLIELLAITLWGNLDFLVIDMPPGIDDVTLDTIKFVKRVNFVIVTTPSRLAFETVKKLISLMSESKNTIIGVIENMKMNEAHYVQQAIERMGIRFLGEIYFDFKIEEALGDVNKLLRTEFCRRLEEISTRIILSLSEGSSNTILTGQE